MLNNECNHSKGFISNWQEVSERKEIKCQLLSTNIELIMGIKIFLADIVEDTSSDQLMLDVFV